MTDMLEFAKRALVEPGDDGYEPTAGLRFAVPPETTTKPPRLQQCWRKPRYNGWGHVEGWEYQWRDVPTEVVSHS